MNISEEIVKVDSGNFGDCLVEGSAEDKKRGRKSKHRAIAISVALQSLGLTALVIAPMLAKPAEIRTTTVMPIPPYSAPHQPSAATQTIIDRHPRPCVICPTRPITPISGSMTRDEAPGPIDLGPIQIPGKQEAPDGLKISDPRSQALTPPPAEKKRLVVGHIDPALLVNRVEPVFPPLLRQLHRNGRVELRALIATDGTIQSLQVVSGDPLCVQSALDAVRQWRYKPTLLNGQPVEVDTFITVIYTVNQQ